MHESSPDIISVKNMILNELIELYGSDVLKIANIYMRSKEAAEDVFQEVFFRVYRHLDTYENVQEVKKWLMRITINVCKDMRSCPWNNKCFLLSEDDESLVNIKDTEFDNKVDILETNDIVWRILQSMPNKYKDILILYCIKEFSYKEISDVLNISDSAVKTRLRRARMVFRNQYEKLLSKSS